MVSAAAWVLFGISLTDDLSVSQVRHPRPISPVNDDTRCIPLVKQTMLGVIFCLFSAVCLAADVRIDDNNNNMAAVFITGPIEKGDFDKVQEATRRLVLIPKTIRDNRLLFILDSPGGDVEEAMRIGRFLREMLASTEAMGNRIMHESEDEDSWILNERKKGAQGQARTQNYVVYSDAAPLDDTAFNRCYSACVLIFLGGVEKRFYDNYYWIDGFRSDTSNDVPVIGLHRPYYDKAQYATLSAHEASSSYKNLEQAVIQYLEDVGASSDLIDRMFRTPSNEIDLVDYSTFLEMIQLEEPFYAEWLIAKCSATDDGSNIVSEDDFKYLTMFGEAIDKSVKYSSRNNGETFADYMQARDNFTLDGQSRDRYDEIMSRIRAHNFGVRDCRIKAVRQHQLEMLSTF